MCKIQGKCSNLNSGKPRKAETAESKQNHPAKPPVFSVYSKDEAALPASTPVNSLPMPFDDHQESTLPLTFCSRICLLCCKNLSENLNQKE